jgi:hypothetical protein
MEAAARRISFDGLPRANETWKFKSSHFFLFTLLKNKRMHVTPARILYLFRGDMLIRFAVLYNALSLLQRAQIPVDTNITLKETFTHRRQGLFRLYLHLTNYVVMEP